MFIAVDPGEMCGLAACHSDGSLAFAMESPPFETVSWVHAKPLIAPNCHLIVERYVITMQTAKMTRQYDALETIGALRFVARQRSMTFEMQSRSDRTKVLDSWLKHLGWWMRTKDGHANDAARHLWLAFARHNPQHDLVKQLLDTI